jgi:hypothetical protein
MFRTSFVHATTIDIVTDHNGHFDASPFHFDPSDASANGGGHDANNNDDSDNDNDTSDNATGDNTNNDVNDSDNDDSDNDHDRIGDIIDNSNVIVGDI